LSDRDLVLKYLFFKLDRCEKEVAQYTDNLFIRAAEPYDHLNIVILKARQEMCEEIFKEVYNLLGGKSI